jgi:hypothetical protein
MSVSAGRAGHLAHSRHNLPPHVAVARRVVCPAELEEGTAAQLGAVTPGESKAAGRRPWRRLARAAEAAAVVSPPGSAAPPRAARRILQRRRSPARCPGGGGGQCLTMPSHSHGSTAWSVLSAPLSSPIRLSCVDSLRAATISSLCSVSASKSPPTFLRYDLPRQRGGRSRAWIDAEG